jgi:hypothetical protein
MAKKKVEASQPTVAYRSKNQGCWHSGVYYEPGVLLPEMPLRCLNVHMSGGNVEMVEVADTETIEPVEPESPDVDDTIAVINQIIDDEQRATL